MTRLASQIRETCLEVHVSTTHFRKRALRHLSNACKLEQGTLEDVIKIAAAAVLVLALLAWAKNDGFQAIKDKFSEILNQ